MKALAAKVPDNFTIADLYNSYASAYYGVIIKELYSQKAAAEVFEGSFVQMQTELHSFDPIHSSVFAWGYRIVRSQISMKKAELALQEIFGCRDVEAYREHRALVCSQ